MNVTAIPAHGRHVEPGALRLATVGYGVFRIVNAAFMLPGSILRVPQHTPWPFHLGTAAGAVMLSLLDRESRLWVGLHPDRAEAVSSHLQWLTGCARAPYAENADIAYIDDVGDLARLERVGCGARLRKEASSIVVIEVADLEAAAGPLSGRGIDREALQQPLASIPELAAWRARRARRQRPVEVILTSGDALVALPARTAAG